MEIEKLIESLHPLERKTLNSIKKQTSFDHILEDTKLKEVEVMRALQWLENKEVLKIEKSEKDFIHLDENGKKYVKEDLPERRLLRELREGKEKISETSTLEEEEKGVAIGALKKKAAIDVGKEGITLTNQGLELEKKDSLEEQFLKKNFPLDLSQLKPEEKHAFEILRKRKNIVSLEKKKEITIKLTDLGKEVLNHEIPVEGVVDSLTPEMIQSGEWKNKTFRRYDVKINVPQIDAGRKHFVKEALEYAKNIWLDMGFKEMTGNFVQTSFWNFDTLFTAQDHPVREMQDTFFLKTMPKGKLPDKKIVESVKKAHEGGLEKSNGWGGQWDEEDAKKNVLRTHTTCLSAQTLSKLKKKDMPAKFFALGRCFRNETLDWSHLFELNQTEGIVVDPNANFSHLLGYLKQFFKKMGFEDARFRPAFFAYTEPSVEIEVLHPVHKTWIELGGAGIFRPEVTIPLLGEDIPVLAWGPGFDRIILRYYEINDIRELYNNDIKQLRKIKSWNK